ncbi:MAG: hypothetical protein ABI597_06600 [Gammaproteobacteria bacterium]
MFHDRDPLITNLITAASPDSHETQKPILISDILVSQTGTDPLNPMGELNKLSSHAIRGNRTDDLQRMVDHISMLGRIANAQHIQMYFEKNNEKLTLHQSDQNKITRLSLNEFSLYPHGEPLTLQEFESVTEEIKKLARKFQPNLHLNLASLPVIGQDKKIYNIIIYVQCGELPSLQTFIKTIPSDLDTSYYNIEMPNAAPLSMLPNYMLNGVYLNQVQHIISGIQTRTLTTAAVIDFESLLTSNPNYPVGSKLKSICIRLKDKISTRQPFLPQDINEFVTEAKSHFKKVLETKLEFISLLDASKEQINGLQITDLAKTSGVPFLVQNGTAQCTTAGDEKFTVEIDICLDHSFSTTKNTGDEYSAYLPIAINPESINYLSSSHYPNLSAQLESDSTRISNPAFGGTCVICAYPERVLNLLTGELGFYIDLNGKRLSEMTILQTARTSAKTEIANKLTQSIDEIIAKKIRVAFSYLICPPADIEGNSQRVLIRNLLRDLLVLEDNSSQRMELGLQHDSSDFKTKLLASLENFSSMAQELPDAQSLVRCANYFKQLTINELRDYHEFRIRVGAV